MKKLLIGLRTSIKILALFVIISIIVVTIIMSIYKPIYSVTFKGEELGYSENKATLLAKIEAFTKKGNDDAAFVQIGELPKFKLCFLKRGIETNDEEIYNKVVSTGVPYYRFFTVAVAGEEKVYVESFEEADNIVNQLIEKDSKNARDLSIDEKYMTQKEEFTSIEVAVKDLYENKITEDIRANMGRVTRAGNGGSSYKSTSIAFAKPITARISSRFGSRWGSTHKGLDFGASTGTPIKAAADGTVTFSGWNSGGYGYLVIISHGNGVQTYYGHASELKCKVGDYVYQGDTVALVGNTGDSYGSHLHFEIRINDVAYNPEYYI